MRAVYAAAVLGMILLFLSGCGALNSAVQMSHVSTNTITDMQVDMKVGEKVTSNCTVIRVFGIPFGDSSWFSNKLADNVAYDTNMRRVDTVIASDSSNTNSKTSSSTNAMSAAVDFIMGIVGFNGIADIKECEKVAAYKMASRDGIDVIYAPRYVSDSTGFPVLFRITEVALTGYKGNIVGFRQLDSQNLSK